MKFKYQNPENPEELLYKEISDDEDCNEYLINLHKTKLCDDQNNCNGENCKIWIEVDGEYVLAGIQD